MNHRDFNKSSKSHKNSSVISISAIYVVMEIVRLTANGVHSVTLAIVISVIIPVYIRIQSFS